MEKQRKEAAILHYASVIVFIVYAGRCTSAGPPQGRAKRFDDVASSARHQTHDIRSSRMASSSSLPKGKLRSSVPRTSFRLVIIWWSWNLDTVSNGSAEAVSQMGAPTPSAAF